MLPSAAALLDGLFEHPVGIHFQHRPAKLMGTMFYHLDGQKTTGSLVVLLLVELARSEGACSMRAIKDRPGYPQERYVSKLGRRHY